MIKQTYPCKSPHIFLYGVIFMPKKKKEIPSTREKIGMILDMPIDMIKDCSRVTIIGTENVLVENYKGIVEYEENVIRLNNNINMYGSNLNIEEITDDDMLVSGKIKSIEFDE